VGSTVNAVYTENKKPRSDVLTVVRFLHRVLQDGEWAIKAIQSVLSGKTGLTSPDGQDVFAGRFPFLRELGNAGVTPTIIYHDILKRIFHITGHWQKLLYFNIGRGCAPQRVLFSGRPRPW